MKEETRRKLRIENLTRCMNCLAFSVCNEERKDEVVCCEHYREIKAESQVVVVLLTELCRQDRIGKEKEIIEDLREMAYMLKQELPPISDEELVRRLEKCADRLDILGVRAKKLNVKLR
jgi:hypothetical protein